MTRFQQRLIVAGCVVGLCQAAGSTRILGGVCAVPCQPGDIAENEPDCGQPIDTVNGGCYNPPLLSAISCGQTICGTTTFDPNTFAFDNDTYAFTLASTTRVQFTLDAEFPMQMYLFLGGCPEADPLDTTGASTPCTPLTLARCLPAGAYQLHVFPFTQSPDFAPCGTRYRLSMTCSSCSLAPNLTCGTAISVAVPSQTSGDTSQGFVNASVPACGPPAATRPGLWYRVTGTGHTMTASTCNSITNFDSALSVYCGTCDNLFCAASNDNGNCPTGQNRARVSWCSTAGQSYYILVYGGFGAISGTFRLDIADDGQPCTGATPCTACPNLCGPHDQQENEPNCGLTDLGQPDYTVNGGCATSPPHFTDIDLDRPVCATSAFNGLYRDDDWFQFSTDGNNVISAMVTADFDIEVDIVAAAPRCPSFVPIVKQFGTRCEPFVVTTPCVPQNTYWIIVGPRFTGDTVPCGRPYTLTVHAEPCTLCPVTPAGATCDEVVIPGIDCVHNGVPVICGQSGCALAVHPGGIDVDCYTLNLTQPARVRWRVTAQFAYELQINQIVHAEPNNDYLQTLADAEGAACGPTECVACLEPGDYNLALLTEAGKIPFPFGLPYHFEVLCDDCPPLEPCGPNAIAENEPNCGFPIDTVNGGCTTGPGGTHVFSTIHCGDEICGTTGRDEFNYPDWDYYQLIVNQPTPITWSADVDFPGDIGIIANDGDPANCVIQMLPHTFSLSHTRLSVSKCLTPGTWWLVVGSVNTGLPLPCGTGYRAKLTCGCPCPGDMDGNGVVNGLDIAPLVACFINSYSACDICPCADLNQDRTLDATDISMVIGRLLNGGCP